MSKGYKILSYFTFLNKKMVFDILLEKKVTKERLAAIAATLYAKHNGIYYDKVFMAYYLNSLDIGLGAWATTIYDPVLEIKVWGEEREKYDKLKKNRNRT